MTHTRVIAITAICLIGGAIVLTKVTNDRQFNALAETYRQQAVKQTSASTTAADAKAWLERNGFEVALYGDSAANEETRQTSHGEEKYNIVNGYRRAQGDRWVELVFLFRTTSEPYVPGSFVGVEAHSNSQPTKMMRSEFSRRAATTGATIP